MQLWQEYLWGKEHKTPAGKKRERIKLSFQILATILQKISKFTIGLVALVFAYLVWSDTFFFG